jgi:ABC-type lipoprotein release transport system permease subunit
LVLGQAFVQLAVGLAAGAVLAASLARLLGALLVGVRPFDPLVLAAIVLALVVTSGLACLGPALRATHINPSDALRHD